jgi:hypothetical protein
LTVDEGQPSEIQDNVAHRIGVRFEAIEHIRDLRSGAKVKLAPEFDQGGTPVQLSLDT